MYVSFVYICIYIKLYVYMFVGGKGVLNNVCIKRKRHIICPTYNNNAMSQYKSTKTMLDMSNNLLDSISHYKLIHLLSGFTHFFDEVV